MHAFASPRTPVPPSTVRLRALLAEPGGRRRLVEAMEDRLGSALHLDEEQLLVRAGAWLDGHGAGELAI